jgi:hypothetical protein
VMLPNSGVCWADTTIKQQLIIRARMILMSQSCFLFTWITSPR